MFLWQLFRSFQPLGNPAGFGAGDLIELAVAAILAMLFLGRGWIQRVGGRIAARASGTLPARRWAGMRARAAAKLRGDTDKGLRSAVLVGRGAVHCLVLCLVGARRIRRVYPRIRENPFCYPACSRP